MFKIIGLATAFVCSTSLAAFGLTMVHDHVSPVEPSFSKVLVAATVPAPQVLTVIPVTALHGEPAQLVRASLLIGDDVTPIVSDAAELSDLTLAVATMTPSAISGLKPEAVEQTTLRPLFDDGLHLDDDKADVIQAVLSSPAPRATSAPRAAATLAPVPQPVAAPSEERRINPNGMWLVGVYR